MEIRNAKITGTFLGIHEDRKVFTCFIYLDYGGPTQSFGGHFLKYEKYGFKYLEEIFKVVGVHTWEDLTGEYVRVKSEKNKILAIGNLLKDEWFSPEEDLDK